MPDFAIVGAMKAGSTTLFRRLDAHPATNLPATKEPNYFDRPGHGPRDEVRYRALFPNSNGVTGEASVRYSDPWVSAAVAGRMAQTVPNIRLMFLARDPLQRLRSHYLHEVLRGRETRPLPDVIKDSDSPYVRRSCYFRSLKPFFDFFPREQILVIESENLDQPATWRAVQSFLHLPPVAMETQRYNASHGRPRETALMREIRARGLVGGEARLPRQVRTLLRPLFLRVDTRVVQARAHARDAPVSRQVERVLMAEADRFAVLVGWDRNPWEET